MQWAQIPARHHAQGCRDMPVGPQKTSVIVEALGVQARPSALDETGDGAAIPGMSRQKRGRERVEEQYFCQGGIQEFGQAK